MAARAFTRSARMEGGHVLQPKAKRPGPQHPEMDGGSISTPLVPVSPRYGRSLQQVEAPSRSPGAAARDRSSRLTADFSTIRSPLTRPATLTVAQVFGKFRPEAARSNRSSNLFLATE